MKNRVYFICILFMLFYSVSSKFEGDTCSTEETSGHCILIHKCEHAIKLLKIKQSPKLCGFQRDAPIVCCPTPKQIEIGKISEDKCTAYFPKPKTFFTPIILGGTPTKPKEFPHMALLGYDNRNSPLWLCGGSLISKQFVLTAAHCITSRDYGKVVVVRLGELDIKDASEDAKPEDFEVIQTYSHPKYQSPSHYNDIGLIKLKREVLFNSYISPACLYAKPLLIDKSSQLVSTGWGKTDFLGETSNQLLKAELDFVNQQTCAKFYANSGASRLSNGILEGSQICAGSDTGKDSCQGDSGGPLQIKEMGNSNTKPHYSIVGITSFGKACGGKTAIGVYTRVAAFIPWIEAIVWSK